VRAATVLYKRVVSDALDAGIVAGDDLVGATDEGLMHMLAGRSGAASGTMAARVAGGVAALRSRRLPKRAVEISAGELPEGEGGEWLSIDSTLKRAVEDHVAGELGLPAGGVFLDYPDKPAMFGLDLLLRRRSGSVIRLGPEGHTGLIGLPRIAGELYRSARVLRLYVVERRGEVRAEPFMRLASMSTQQASAAVQAGNRLLPGWA
jgi:uncharacterized protein